jgi:DNA mismatch repair protein MLH3
VASRGVNSIAGHQNLASRDPASGSGSKSLSVTIQDLDRFFSPATTINALPASVGVAFPSGTIGRTGLSHARFLAQVDQKFLACRLPLLDASESSMLVVVDQHAAHERVRIEAILAEACHQASNGAMEAQELSTPLSVPLSEAEATALSRPEVVDEFRRWGLTLSLTTAGREAGGSNHDGQAVEVSAVPKIVADRLASDARTLQELVKQHIAHLEDTSQLDLTRPRRSFTIKDCPSLLRQLFNSKACRGKL